MSRRSGLEYNPIWKKEHLMAEMQSDVQFDHEIQWGSLSFMQFSLQWRCRPWDLFVSRHQTSEMLNFKWTVVDLLLQDNKYIPSLIWLVSDGFTLVQIRNEWNSDQPFFFYLGA